MWNPFNKMSKEEWSKDCSGASKTTPNNSATSKIPQFMTPTQLLTELKVFTAPIQRLSRLSPFLRKKCGLGNTNTNNVFQKCYPTQSFEHLGGLSEQQTTNEGHLSSECIIPRQCCSTEREEEINLMELSATADLEEMETGESKYLKIKQNQTLYRTSPEFRGHTNNELFICHHFKSSPPVPSIDIAVVNCDKEELSLPAESLTDDKEPSLFSAAESSLPWRRMPSEDEIDLMPPALTARVSSEASEGVLEDAPQLASYAHHTALHSQHMHSHHHHGIGIGGHHHSRYVPTNVSGHHHHIYNHHVNHHHHHHHHHHHPSFTSQQTNQAYLLSNTAASGTNSLLSDLLVSSTAPGGSLNTPMSDSARGSSVASTGGDLHHCGGSVQSADGTGTSHLHTESSGGPLPQWSRSNSHDLPTVLEEELDDISLNPRRRHPTLNTTLAIYKNYDEDHKTKETSLLSVPCQTPKMPSSTENNCCIPTSKLTNKTSTDCVIDKPQFFSFCDHRVSSCDNPSSASCAPAAQNYPQVFVFADQQQPQQVSPNSSAQNADGVTSVHDDSSPPALRWSLNDLCAQPVPSDMFRQSEFVRDALDDISLPRRASQIWRGQQREHKASLSDHLSNLSMGATASHMFCRRYSFSPGHGTKTLPLTDENGQESSVGAFQLDRVVGTTSICGPQEGTLNVITTYNTGPFPPGMEPSPPDSETITGSQFDLQSNEARVLLWLQESRRHMSWCMETATDVESAMNAVLSEKVHADEPVLDQ